MFLSSKTITELIAKNELGITPFDDSAFNPTSYELHLSENIFKTSPKEEVFDGNNPKDKLIESITMKNRAYRLEPGGFILGKTSETLYLSEKYMGLFDGKPSLAQIGLFVHISSVLIDPGTNSTITVEVFNASEFPIDLKVGMKIGQVMFSEYK